MADVEVLDLHEPHPSIYELFGHYNRLYFDNALGACALSWSSKRMTACAGVCRCSMAGGCEIRLSEPLLKFRPVSDLKNTLLHEMIHAYLFLTNGNDNHDDHGPNFQEMMSRINNFNVLDYERPNDGYNVTIYHNFNAEVDQYRRHHWRCENCSDYIKRAMNRTPSLSDCVTRTANCLHPACHWHRHQESCGGMYEKVAEPEGYVDKRKRAAMAGGSNEQKFGQISTNEVNSKKVSKEGGTIKTKSLEAYFGPAKPESRSMATEDVSSEIDHDGENSVADQNTSPAGSVSTLATNGYIAMSDPDNSTRKTRSSGRIEESRERNCHRRTYLYLSEDEEDGFNDSLVTDYRKKHKTAAHVSTSAKLPAHPKPSKSSRQRRSCNELSESNAHVSKRKRMETIALGSSSQRQDCRDPLVILAWANWVTYESDEEDEVPLINKRTEKRKRGKMVYLELPGEERLPTPEQDAISGRPLESDLQSNVVVFPEEAQGRSNATFEHNPNQEQATPLVVGEDNDTKLDLSYIELTDDDGDTDIAIGRSSDGRQQTIQKRYFRRRIRSTHVESMNREDPASVLTDPTGGRITERPGETHVSTMGGEEHGLRLELPPSGASSAPCCPLCTILFPADADNDYINRHVDECLAQITISEMQQNELGEWHAEMEVEG